MAPPTSGDPLMRIVTFKLPVCNQLSINAFHHAGEEGVVPPGPTELRDKTGVEQATQAASRRVRRELAIPSANRRACPVQGVLSEPRRGGTSERRAQAGERLRMLQPELAPRRLTAGLSPQEEEFRWLLHDEVHAVLRQLQDILKEASLRFTLPGSGTEGPTKQENFILGSCGTDQVKGVLTLQGDALSQADVNLKMPRNNQLLHFAFREDKQWKLQQIQDARNHVSQAIYLLANRDESYQFRTGAEVLKLMDAVMLQLTRARNRLTTPATLTLPEIAASGLTRMFAPTLPSDLLVNVYINLNKLCLTVYQLHTLQPNSTKNFRPAGGAVLHSPGAMFEWGTQRLEVSHVHKVESVIPWLNDALVFFTVSLQLCQQLKDKISVFSSYWSCRPF
nr:PREDICTED: protein rogdi homolog [Bos indicus]